MSGSNNSEQYGKIRKNVISGLETSTNPLTTKQWELNHSLKHVQERTDE